MQTHQYAYIVLAIVLWIFGYIHTGRHLRPRWKITGRLLFYLGVSVLLTLYLNHFSLMFIVGFPLVGLISHTHICERHGINWWTCQPTDKFNAVQSRWGSWDI